MPNFAATVSVGEKEICPGAAARICMRRPDRSRELPFLDLLRRLRVDRLAEQMRRQPCSLVYLELLCSYETVFFFSQYFSVS